jgi:ribosome biogenesis GTPase A
MLARYKLKKLPVTTLQMLEIIGSKRGGLRAGGVIDMHKAAEVMIHDIRGSKLGLISYETVAEWQVKFEEQKQRLIDDQIEREKEQEKQALIDAERVQRDAQRQSYKAQNAIDDKRRERAENETKAQAFQVKDSETNDRGDQ